MKENKGITLIALIVTIIVLLILAAVSIATLMGKNGVITNAQKTSTQNAYEGAIEQVKLAYMAVRTTILANVVSDGTYNARTDHAALKTVVSDDLSGSEWKVDSEEGKISIRYRDTAIDAATIGSVKYDKYTAGTTVNNVTPITNALDTVTAPRLEGYVYFEIILSEQDAKLNIDVPEIAAVK